jgi:hypothetical protein
VDRRDDQQEEAMENTARSDERVHARTRPLGEVAQRGLEPMANWIETSQRLWLDLWHMSTAAARENLRLATELQASTLELATTPLSGWTELQRELGDWYQQAVRSGMESVQRACTSVLEHAENGAARGAGEPEEEGERRPGPRSLRTDGGNGRRRSRVRDLA